MSQQDNKNPAYNLQLTYHFNGKIDSEIFNKSIGLLFDRHHTMFSVFKHKDGFPYIEIIKSEVCVEIIDFSEISFEIRKEEIFAFAIEDSRRCFDIENGPLFRLYLLKEHEESYYFHATIHHIIFDGWSRRVFVQDLSRIYLNLIHGINDNLEPLDFHSYDYALTEKESMTAEEEADLNSFWKEYLRGCPPELRLPYNYSRRIRSTGLGRRGSFELSEKCTSKLRDLSKMGDTTIFNTVLSLIGILFQKYSGENDICIGVPVSNRRFHPELDKIFGLFINTAVVRLQVDDNNKFKDHISYTKNVVKKALSHSKLPFEMIVEAVNPERISGVNPLFQVSLSWMTDLTIPIDFGAIKGDRVTLPEGISPFDITFYMWEEGKTIKGDIEYNIDVFEDNTIIRLRDNFLHLVQEAVESPGQTISKISIISENDRKKLSEFNKTEVSVPSCLLQEFFEQQVFINGDKTSVVSGNNKISYRELENSSNQLAHHLISLGVTGGDVVGICIERSVEMMMSVLGILKAGCCYLPMDPLFPDDRLAYMYEDSGAKVLISQSSLKEKFRHFPNTSIVLTDKDKGRLSKYSTERPELLIDNQSLAYLIYTSGSTGKPKGVKVHHEAVVNFLGSMKRSPGISQEDRLLAVTTLSFDISVLELFLPLSVGAELIIADTDDIFDGQRLSDLLDRHDVTIMQATPATWNILLGNGWKGKKNLKALCGGEAILPGLVSDLLSRVESFWNMYGPTETTVWSTCKQLINAEPPILIGTPIDNTQIYILDKYNKEVPVGAIGEVCIGGLGVTKGYNIRPELTAEKFIGFGEAGIIYKTGDLGRFLADGNIELFGRSDNQIKLRGFRIEPGEIESLLSRLSGVKEAVVKLQKFGDNDERLVAFLNVDVGFKLTKEEIAASLSQYLPGYMIPSFYQPMEGFPRLPNGKINKKALIYEITESEQRREIDLASLTATQQKLIALCGQILKIQSISLTDNFFDIGGNSLLGIRLLNRIREEFGITITFMDFLLNPTIENLGAFIDNQIGDKEKNITLKHLTQTDRLPLTSNQKRLWLISQLEPDIPTYIIRLTYKFQGILNLEIFERSLGILFERHHVVFSVIKEIDNELYCEIVPREVKASYIDYTGVTKEEIKGKVTAILNEDSRQAFNLSQGPLYRLYLIKAAEYEYYFHMSIHHIIFDGWSQSVLGNDLSKIYNSLIKGEGVELEALEYQQYDYAQWEANAEIKKESVAFWEENLRGCSPVLNFPYDYQRSGKSTGIGGLEEIRLSKALSDDLRRISKEEGSSLFSTVLSAFGVLMHKYSGDDDLNIGLPVVHRPHSKLENIFGMFVNTLVLRLKYEKGDTFRDLIKRTNATALNAISHQDITFNTVVEAVKPERISNANPLFQIAFAWQNNLSAPIKLEGIVSETVTGLERAAIFDLILYLWENDDIIGGEIEYNVDLIRPETITRLRDNLLVLLYNLVKNIDEPVNSVSMLTDADKMLINKINDTQTNYPKDKTIAQLFEDQVELYPEKTAVVFKGSSLTYKQLNEMSNQLVGTLRTSGVKNNTPVGILTDKSLEMIIGILAIIKAGGVYVPIDPEYPEQRINFIIEDSECKVLLVQDKYKNVSVSEVKKINLNSSDSYQGVKTNIAQINKSSGLAYIMYTSGTTGKPKGSVIRQNSIVRLIHNTNYIELTPSDKLLLTGAIVFDATTFEIWGMLLNGGTLYIVDRDTILDPMALGEELIKNDITILWLTSALFTQIAEQRTDIFSKLKYLLTGGDVLYAPYINKVRKDNPNLKVINGYGPTENTTFSTTYLIKNDFDHNIPIGVPISNSTAYIFDKWMNYQSVGVIGDLYVGGDGLSTGYLKREDLNSTCFLDNPHNPGERLYKTGDLARWLPDGNIEFRGRVDNQLKIRGFRVELEEIESVILEIDGVIETVIKPVKVEQGNYRLVAFLNVTEAFNMDTKEIGRLIRMKLPAYMVPSGFKYMHGFPKTINGKIDKKSLTFEISELASKSRQDKSDFTPTERSLHNIWCEVLKTDDVCLTDSFFDIGGDSLLGLKLINQLREKFGITLTFRELVTNSTIDQLGILIDTQTRGSEQVIELVHLTEMKQLPLTRNQKKLWIISKLQPDIASYIIPYTYKLYGSLSTEIFQKSIDILFRRHHVVFSVIKEMQGNPYCDIVPSKVDISFIDYSGLPENEKSKKVYDLFDADTRIVFDLQNGPLYRLYLIKTASDEYYFRMSIHHIIFDGWSWSVMTKDLNNIYNCLLRGKEINLEKLEFQQYDYAQWEKNFVDSKHEAESIEFWKENLDGASTILNFPYDFQRTGQPSGRCRSETIQLSQELTEKLKMIGKTEASSLFTTMLSAFGIQMQKYSGEDDLNIGLSVAYRPHSKLENIFGMFVNTVVVRLRYTKESTFRNIIHGTSEAALNAIAHQDLPFEKVVEIVNPDRSSNANPLFQVGFTWLNNLEESITLDGVRSEKVTGKEGTSIFDISFYMWENENHVEGIMEYNIDILTRETMILFRNNFIHLLQSVIENPDLVISDISLISEDDKKRIYELNNTNTPYEHDLCIHQKFEQQVSKNPDLPALLGKKQSISYKELNDHSNRIANYLIKRGVKVEDKIGICIDRSLEMMISIFGTLKAGAAYLPLSPDNPTERLRSIISDANPKIIFSAKESAINIPEESEIVFIDDILQKPLSENSSNPDVKMSSHNLAYVLYTSGSTGMPKGVMIEHHSVLNRLGWMQKAYPIDKTDTLLQKTPITFDVSVWELFWWSFNGAKLVLLPKGGEKDPETLIEYITDYRVTTIHFVPSMFASFFDTIITRKLCGKLENLNRIFLSGEALTLTLVRDFNEMRTSYSLPDLINLYGPTEATVDVSYYNCPQENIKNVYIGKPIDNTNLFVVNSKNIIQPIGVPGELLITGVNLARGYINKPELTAEKFFDFKISDEQYIRAYHTGDLVKLTAEGEIDYLGRMDNQIKIRGFRIELGDIEAKILEHPMVTHSAVIMIEKGQHKYLVAYVCLKPGSEIEADKLKNYLSGKLPDYMVPPYIVFMETLPLTSSGKLNRKSLPSPNRIIEKSAIVTPSNKNERILFNMWKDLLKIDNISINDNFFDIGGNSLLAINLANMISREFNIPLKALMIFEYPSIKAQSEWISGNREYDPSVKNIEIDEKTKTKKNVRFKRLR